MNQIARHFGEVRRQATVAKIIFAPLGVLALIYWVSRQRSLVVDTDITLLLLGAVLALLSVVPFALRLQKVLSVIELQISNLTATRILSQSMFYYFFVPLSVGTELSKFAKLQHLDQNRSSTSIASAILLDHFVGLSVLLVLSSSLYAIVQPIKVDLDTTTLALIAIGVCLALIGLAILSKSKPKLNPHHLIKLIKLQKGKLLVASIYSILMHLLIAAAVATGALHWQIDISYLEILFVLTGAFLFQMIPINFIGVSAIEVAGAGLYLAVGLPATEALMLVSLLYCYRVLIALIGGGWEFTDAWSQNK